MAHRLGRVFLDTNVILTGAFFDGPAQRLPRLGPGGFCYSAHVCRELRYKIRGLRRSALVTSIAQAIVRRYLRGLGAICVPDAQPPTTEGIVDPDDVLVYGAALTYADVLCTYDWTHFPAGPLRVMSPDDVLSKGSDGVGLDRHLKAVDLGEEGTLLLITHPMGVQRISILRCSAGNEVACDRNGYFHVTGPDVRSEKVSRPLWKLPFLLQRHSITVRYNKQNVEIASWIKEPGGSGWAQRILTTAAARLTPPIQMLFAGPDSEYCGTIRCLAGTPRYIGSPKRLMRALDAESLDAVVNSGDLRVAMDELAEEIRVRPAAFNVIGPVQG